MKKNLKWSKRITIGILVFVFLLAIVGSSYQYIATKIDEKKYPPPGKLIDIGGYRLHLHSMGIEGPTVVLDAGLGCISADWGLVQPEIAKFTRVVTYDRAGMGWSDKGPLPRTSEQIVLELHTLLHIAKVPGPYIIVGHSFGGANMQLFAATFPEEVLGVILVDSCHEAQERRLPPNPYNDQMKLMQKPMVIKLITTLGISRILSNMNMKTATIVPQSMWDTRKALCLTTKYFCVRSEEEKVLVVSLKQLEEADRSALANKPCIIITAGALPDISAYGIPENQKKYLQEMFVVWNELQKELAAKFRNSQQMIAQKSDHMIPFHQPEIIVEAVKKIVEETKLKDR